MRRDNMRTRQVITVAVSVFLAAFAAPAARPAQKLQAGISVEMPVTLAARPVPEADNEDAVVVAVTADGGAYLGISQLSPAALAEEAKGRLARQTNKDVYVKADARASYANVAKVLEALHAAGLESAILLTNQRVSSQPGQLVPPMGLAVLIGMKLPSGSEPALVEVLKSTEPRPALKVNNRPVAPSALERTLTQLFQNRSEKVVLVKADRTLAFGDVVGAMDISRSTGAKVVLATPAT